MVVMKGTRQLRSFAVVNVQKESGCPSKFNESSRLVGSTPVSAAKKAFSRLCNLKRIKGKCTFVITVVDTTNGYVKKGKEYTYKVDRVKLAKPIVLQKGSNSEYKINYEVKAKKANMKRKTTGSCGKGKTHGPMKKSTPRKNKQHEKKQRSLKKRQSAKKSMSIKNIANRLKLSR